MSERWEDENTIWLSDNERVTLYPMTDGFLWEFHIYSGNIPTFTTNNFDADSVTREEAIQAAQVAAQANL